MISGGISALDIGCAVDFHERKNHLNRSTPGWHSGGGCDSH
jgi:hypothetical protein